MIDTLRTMTQPLSHWLISHPYETIVGLGLLLMWTTGQALLTHWRSQRLHRDTAATRGDSRSVVRRYDTTATPARASEPESTTGLPPIRGGRTYARNLGNALQKAGMAPPPVYSPPTPTGWSPAPQPGRGTPPAPPPYAPATPPWASPAQPMPPSGPPPAHLPAGTTAWPTYVPPSQPQPLPSQPMQPGPPLFAGPHGPMGPAIAPPPSQAPPHYEGPAAPPTMPPGFGPLFTPGLPLSEPVPPPLPSFTPPGLPSEAVSAPAPAEPKPAKAKRRRFSLLQNLEKTLQRTTGLGQAGQVAEPPVTAPPPAPVTSFTPAVATPAPARPSAPVTPVPIPGIPTPAEETEETAGPVVEAEEPPALLAEAEEPAIPVVEAKEAEEELAPPTGETDSATEPAAPESEPALSGTRAAMRAMLFGQEATKTEPVSEAPAAEPQTEAEEAVFRFEPIVAEPAESGDQTTPVEEPAEPVETAAERFDVPEETSPQPVGGYWETESPAFTHDAMTEHSEAEATPLFETEMAEPAAVEPQGAAPASNETPMGGDRGNLVIIEDDPGVAEYYATLFRGNGYTVQVASDGISGVDLCIKAKPQVILLDVMMPRQNGMLVLQTLRASDETKETPVVVLSNFSEPTLVKRALQLGALEYVIKTQVEGAALLEAMPRWLNREKAFAAA